MMKKTLIPLLLATVLVLTGCSRLSDNSPVTERKPPLLDRNIPEVIETVSFALG